jgi:hypothetical protein
VVVAEVAAAAADQRLVDERLAIKDVVQLAGIDQATFRRLRQLDTDTSDDALLRRRRDKGPSEMHEEADRFQVERQ